MTTGHPGQVRLSRRMRRTSCPTITDKDDFGKQTQTLPNTSKPLNKAPHRELRNAAHTHTQLTAPGGGGPTKNVASVQTRGGRRASHTDTHRAHACELSMSSTLHVHVASENNVSSDVQCKPLAPIMCTSSLNDYCTCSASTITM